MGSAHVTVLGVGRIGLPVAANLVNAGYAVSAFDVRAERRPHVAACGARWVGSARGAAAGAEVLITVLPGGGELESLLRPGEQAGLLAALAPGSTWVDLTSAGPQVDARLAQDAVRRGVQHLDAGVAGGVEEARRGALGLFVGGDAAVFEALRPLLACIADPRRTVLMGAEGTGHLTKLLVNLLWFGQAIAVGEALLLAGRAGLDPAALAQVLPHSAAASEFAVSALPRLLAGDYLASFELDRCVEQLDTLARLAARTRTPFELSEQVLLAHQEALAAFGAVPGELLGVAYLEQRAGTLIRAREPSDSGTDLGYGADRGATS